MRTSLCVSNGRPSSQTRVTSVKSLSSFSFPNVVQRLSRNSFHFKHNFSSRLCILMQLLILYSLFQIRNKRWQCCLSVKFSLTPNCDCVINIYRSVKRSLPNSQPGVVAIISSPQTVSAVKANLISPASTDELAPTNAVKLNMLSQRLQQCKKM